MFQYKSIISLSLLIALQSYAEVPECRENSLWEKTTLKTRILDNEPLACKELCRLLSQSVVSQSCEHETGGRGYERSFAGEIFQARNLACIKFRYIYSKNDSDFRYSCFLKM